MELVFIHGWSVKSTATYGHLPARIEAELRARDTSTTIRHIYLGKYVSFSDSVTLDDLALAFDNAIRDNHLTNFSCITHSTGGPLVRNWMLKHAAANPAKLRHLIMLAPPNHGSALAQLGKGRLSRIKAFFESVEPGQRILDWLELGSAEQWQLNWDWLQLDAPTQGTFPFVLTGQTIDRKFYDHLNSYTGETGSDGVIRVAAANLNYQYVRLNQRNDGQLHATQWRSSHETPLAVIAGRSHSNERIGIMKSTAATGPSETVDYILACLAVDNPDAYRKLAAQMWSATRNTQQRERIPTHSMVVFRIIDDRGNPIEDFDLLFTAGADSSPDRLPKGFFRDRQRNSRHRNKLTFYVESAALDRTPIGFQLQARPDQGLVRYRPATMTPERLGPALRPNETLMVDIVLQRIVEPKTFLFTKNRLPEPIAA